MSRAADALWRTLRGVRPGEVTMTVTVLSLGTTLIALSSILAPHVAAATSGLLYVIASLVLHPSCGLRHDPFHPNVVFKVIMAIGYFPSLIVGPEWPLSRSSQLLIALSGIVFVVGLDIFGLLASSMIPARMRLRRQRPAPRSHRVKLGIFVTLSIVGWLWRLYALRTGQIFGTFLATQLDVGAFSNAMGMLSQLSYLSFLGIAVFSQSVWFVAVAAILELIWALISGSKAAVLYIALPLLLILFRKGKIRITRRLMLGALVVGCSLIASFAVIHQYRLSAQRILAHGSSADFSFLGSLSSISVSGGDVLSSANAILSRVQISGSVVRLVSSDESSHLTRWWGESYLPLSYWFVPRAIWPEKPSVSVGAWFGRTILGWDSDSRSEGAITVFGEGYMNFGWPGAFGAPLVWAAIVTLGYHALLRSGLWGLLFLALMYMRLVLSIEQNVSVMFVAGQVTALSIGAIWLVASSIESVARRTRGTRRLR